MTEQDWLTEDDPFRMLRLLDGRIIASGAPEAVETSGRKLRLFACGCARLVWDKLADDRSRAAVDVAERFADGLATGHELMAASVAVQDVGDQDWATFPPVSIGGVRATVDSFESCWSTPHRAAQLPSPSAQAYLLRDVVSNPWRPVTTESLGISSMDGLAIATSIAHAAYDERLPDGTIDSVRLAILADALEEAGCPGPTVCDWCRGDGDMAARGCKCIDACYAAGWASPGECGWLPPHPLLVHLRSPGPHVRGCWAVDLILGKE